jgi:hypothetical protein
MDGNSENTFSLVRLVKASASRAPGSSRKITPDGDGRWNDHDYREKHDQDDHGTVDVTEALSERGPLNVAVISIVLIAHDRESRRLASGWIVKLGGAVAYGDDYGENLDSNPSTEWS